MTQIQILTIALFSLISQSAFSATLAITSPLSGAKVADTFVLSGTCSRKSAVTISGALTNPGSTPCNSPGRFSYTVKVGTTTGTKLLTIKQTYSGSTKSVNASYSYTAPVVVTPLPAPSPTPAPEPTPTPTPDTSVYPVYPGCESPATTYARTLYIDPAVGTDLGDGTATNPLRTLGASLSKIKPGDHVILKPGHHGSASATRYSHPTLANSTQWIWFDFKPGATIEKISMTGESAYKLGRLLITGAEISGPRATYLYFMSNANVVVADSKIYTAKDTSAWTATDWMSATGSGISTRNTVCASFVRNEIKNVRMGVIIQNDALSPTANRSKTLVQDTLIQGYSADGIRPIASDVILRNNTIMDVYVSAADGDGNHDDAIQGYALNGASFDNLLIEGTYIQETTNPLRKFNTYTQGIVIFDGLYTNVTVRDNVIISQAWHGIALYGIKNGLIENNTVVSNIGRGIWIKVPNAKSDAWVPENVIIRNNIAPSVQGTSTTTTITSSNNFTLTDYTGTFLKFDVPNASFDLRIKSTSPIYGKGIGAY